MGQNNKFEEQIADADLLIHWIGEHLSELDYQEMFITFNVYMNFAEAIRPIYERHNTKKFTLWTDKEK